MELKWHGHSCISIQTDDYSIVIDPFITGNPQSDLVVSEVKCDYIILTHGHDDHVGDTITLAQANNAEVIGIVELMALLAKDGVKTSALNLGGTGHYPFGSVKLVPAWHTSSYKGKYAGVSAGVIIEIEGIRIYHMGDTCLFSDLSLIKNIDYTFIPIGDTYTMGIEDAVEATKIMDSKYYIPVHYNTFPPIKQNPEIFISGLESSKGVLPKIGEGIITLTNT